MKISLVTCVITTTILLTMAWGKHFIIKTKDTTKKDTMKYAKGHAANAIHGKPVGDYDVGGNSRVRPSLPKFAN